jgi:acetyl esterase/lipase
MSQLQIGTGTYISRWTGGIRSTFLNIVLIFLINDAWMLRQDVEDTLAAVLSSTISIPSRPEIVLSSTRLTVSGFSAGGALALAASALDPFPRLPALLNLQHALKGVVLYYGVLDLRVSPQQKVIPQKIIEMSKRDPVGKMVVVLEPLYTDNHNPRITEQWRCSPTLMPASYIPRNLTILAPELDPLADEEEKFVQRVRKESDEHGLGIKIDYRKYKGCLHGWTHLPKFVNGEEAERMKQEALTAGVEAIKRALFGE